MSTIYSLPTTIIQTNGSRSYRIKTKDYDAILQHVEVESKTNETINLNFEDLYFESIAFKGNSDLGETTLKCVRNTMDVKNYYTVDSRPITCAEGLKEEYLPELQFLVSRGYVIDIPVPIFKDIKLDLNNAWRRCQTYDSPLEGWTLYESASNWHVGGESSICYLNIVSNDAPLVIYYCSYAEAQFDWLNIGFPDGTGVDTLRSWQEPPTSIDTMGLVEKSADLTGVCTITYQKDDSVDRFDDRGYILLPNDIPFVNEYVEPVPEPIYIQSMNIFGSESIKTEGTVEYFASIFPVDADTYNLGWYIDDAPTGVVARIRWTADNPKYAYLEVESIDAGVDSEITIVCYDDVSGVEQSYSIRIYKEAAPVVSGSIYYTTSHQLNKAISSWSTKTWINPPEDKDFGVWTDGTNIYSYNSDSNLVLDKATSTWNQKTWSGLTNFDPWHIWTDGENIYYSFQRNHYVLDKTTSTWTKKTWSGLTYFNAYDVWSDGENIYCNMDNTYYVLNKATSTWNTKSWNITFPLRGSGVWTDGENIYFSNSQYQFVFNKLTSTWESKTWNGGVTRPDGGAIWTDGENIYYSSDSMQYVLDKATSTWNQKTWSGLTSFSESLVWSDNPQFKISCCCVCTTFGAFNQ